MFFNKVNIIMRVSVIEELIIDVEVKGIIFMVKLVDEFFFKVRNISIIIKSMFWFFCWSIINF